MLNVVEEIPVELRPAADAALAWINREKGSQFRLTPRPAGSSPSDDWPRACSLDARRSELRSYVKSGVVNAIRAAGGEVFGMTSEPQSLATEASETWEIGFACIGDPHHEIRDTLQKRGPVAAPRRHPGCRVGRVPGVRAARPILAGVPHHDAGPRLVPSTQSVPARPPRRQAVRKRPENERRVAAFAAAWVAALVLLPPVWVALGLAAWVAIALPGVAALYRQFQHIPNAEPKMGGP